jgi:diacylglycerol kinase family enzyme
MGRMAHSKARGSQGLERFLTGFLIINPHSGSGNPNADELAAEARARGIEAHVLVSGEDPARLARASSAEALGVAGGDGSLAPVAEVALERGAAFAAVPFGTRNHFARDLGLDRNDPLGALDAFRGGERRIDVGRAADQLFLNNVSIGIYARLVHQREGHRRRRELFARARAWAIVIRHRGRLGLTIDGDPVETRLLLVANNAYALEFPSIGARERLDEGRLHLYSLGADPPERTGERFVVDAASRELEAAIDGEPVKLQMPVEFRVEPKALRVLLPEGR